MPDRPRPNNATTTRTTIVRTAMPDPLADSDTPPLPQGRFAGPQAFAALIRQALGSAACQGWSQLILCDADFADWPLGERAVVGALQQWARKGRQCTLLALDYTDLERRQPRFVQWRRQFDHLLTCRRALTTEASSLPSALWTPDWVLQRHDPHSNQGWTGSEPQRRLALAQDLQEWLQHQSTPAFPASVLGL